MRTLFQISAATAALLVAGSFSAFAACNGDTGTETVLGAASGAAVGGLASHSIAGAAIGGVAGGVIGNAIGQSNNREDCRRDAQYYDGQGQAHYQGQQGAYDGRGYNQQSNQQQDYNWRRRNDEQQRQAYDSRYPNASPTNYGRRSENDNMYTDQSYSRSQHPDDPSERSSDYRDYSDGR